MPVSGTRTSRFLASATPFSTAGGTSFALPKPEPDDALAVARGRRGREKLNRRPPFMTFAERLTLTTVSVRYRPSAADVVDLAAHPVSFAGSRAATPAARSASATALTRPWYLYGPRSKQAALMPSATPSCAEVLARRPSRRRRCRPWPARATWSTARRACAPPRRRSSCSQTCCLVRWTVTRGALGRAADAAADAVGAGQAALGQELLQSSRLTSPRPRRTCRPSGRRPRRRSGRPCPCRARAGATLRSSAANWPTTCLS